MKPLATVLIISFDVIHVLVAEHDIENWDDKDNSADKSLSLQLFDGEVSHHAHLKTDNDDEGCVCRRLDQVTLRVDLLAIHI